jgi:hypothetical protein
MARDTRTALNTNGKTRHSWLVTDFKEESIQSLTLKNDVLRQIWWYTLIIPALGRISQEDWDFKPILSFLVSFRLSYIIFLRSCLKKKKKEQNQKKNYFIAVNFLKMPLVRLRYFSFIPRLLNSFHFILALFLLGKFY